MIIPWIFIVLGLLWATLHAFAKQGPPAERRPKRPAPGELPEESAFFDDTDPPEK